MLTVVGLLWQVSIGCRDWAERGQRIADAVNSFVPDNNWKPTGPSEEDILAVTKVKDRVVKGSLEDKLMSAIANGDSKAAKTHIAAGANVNARDEGNKTVLMRAAAKGHADIVKVLIDAGADVNAKDSFDCTAFFHAADKKHVDIVKILIAAGDASDRVTFEGVFISAVHSGNTEMVKALMVESARIERDTLETAYMMALNGHKSEILNVIKDHLKNLDSSEVVD